MMQQKQGQIKEDKKGEVPSTTDPQDEFKEFLKGFEESINTSLGIYWEKVLIKFDTVIDNQIKILRGQENLDNSLNTVHSDRNVLEDIQGTLTKLLEESKLSRQHEVEGKQEIKFEVQNAGAKVEKKVKEEVAKVNENIQSKEAIISPDGITIPKELKRKRFFQKIKDAIIPPGPVVVPPPKS